MAVARLVIGRRREVDGMEFEHSSVALDLRFIPDDVSFEGRQARDKSTSVPSSYQPPSFICKALQQTKVECTWDEAPSERQVLLGRVSQWRDAAEEDFEVTSNIPVFALSELHDS
ncbi:unnamed protein product, partial [Scytosiphon promiscuus]